MSDAGGNLLEQQAANRRATRMWVVLFILFFAWIGFGGDAVLYLGSVDPATGLAAYRVPYIGLVVTLIAAVTALVSWRKGPQQILWSSGARELVTATTPEERQLLNVVEEMAIASGLPRPKVYLVDDDDPNAFATGRDPQSACVAVTTGLLKTLNREELQGVIGHEMAHVRNLDVRLMTVIAALVGVIVLMSDGLGRFLRHGGGRVLGRGGKKGGAGALVLVVLVLWIVTLILAPFITRLMAMAVSRKREYLADATGAELTRNPAALAGALQKLETATAPTTAIKRGTAHLCIADPLGRGVNHREGRFADLFGTHPPMAMRISRLKGMAYQSAKAAGGPPAA